MSDALNTLRARIPFAAEDEDALPVEPLGEEEQEKIIATLRTESDKANSTHMQVLRALIGMSILLQILDPIPIWFSITNTLLHVNALIAISPELLPWISNKLGIFTQELEYFQPIPILYTMIIAALPSFALWTASSGRVRTLRLFETPILLLIIFLGDKWEKEAQRDLEELEKLKFQARSA